MKKRKKAGIVIAIACIVLGTFLCIVGGVMGADEIGRYLDRRWEEGVGWMDSEWKELEWEEGLETPNNVRSLDFEIKYGQMRIVKGDEFYVKTSNMGNRGVKSYMDGDTWVIEDESDFFYTGWPFVRRMFQNRHPVVEIGLPEGFQAQEMELSIDAGTLDVEAIAGEELELSVGAGRATMDEVRATTSFKAEVGAGELALEQIDARDAKINCGAGKIYVQGVIIGESKVDCGIGEVDMDLSGNPDDYDYKVDCGLGQVLINGDSYRVSPSIRENNQAEYQFKVNCGLGQVSLDVRQ